MHESSLTINIAHHKHQIELDYRGFRQAMYRCLHAALIEIDSIVRPVVCTSEIDDEHYNLLLRDTTVNQFHNLAFNLKLVLGTDFAGMVYHDLFPYLSEFLSHRHNPKFINFLSLEIDNSYRLIVKNRWLKPRTSNDTTNSSYYCFIPAPQVSGRRYAYRQVDDRTD